MDTWGDNRYKFPISSLWYLGFSASSICRWRHALLQMFWPSIVECLGDQLWPFWVATTTTTTVRAQDNSQSHCGITEFQTFKLGNVTMCLVTLTLAFGAPLHPRLEIVSLRHFVFWSNEFKWSQQNRTNVLASLRHHVRFLRLLVSLETYLLVRSAVNDTPWHSWVRLCVRACAFVAEGAGVWSTFSKRDSSGATRTKGTDEGIMKNTSA